MSQTTLETMTSNRVSAEAIREQVNSKIENLLAVFPDPATLSSKERRDIIARYTAVLEGNFIYWMTAALITVGTEKAREEIVENLDEEIRECHPAMMRRFAIAAKAAPTDSDAAAVYENLSKVRGFVGKLSTVRLLIMLMFFESFIQKYMPYLAELAKLQGSNDFEYTDVHGVCDIAHSEGLFEAVKAEAAHSDDSLTPETNPLEGVELLQTLVKNIAAAA